MDKIAALEKFEKVKELINGAEAENFKEKYFARFFSGDITLVIDKVPYTLTFHKGTMIDVMHGKPLNGINFGLGGLQAQWDEFFEHRNFQFATSAKRNPNCFEFLGSPLAFRQNNNVIAHLMRVLAMVMSK
jgi:hypothetical protein